MDLFNFTKTSSFQVPTNEIYKIFTFGSDGQVKHIYIFCGSETYSSWQTLFSQTEFDYIAANQIQLHYSTQLLHKDDTICALKKKIIHELGKNAISYDELYLFSKIIKRHDWMKIYNDLTENDKIGLSKEMFAQWMVNYDIHPTADLSEKDTYDYNDMIELVSITDMREFKIPIGRRFIKQQSPPLFSANPFDVLSGISTSTNTLAAFENELLLNYGSIVDQNIYMVAAEHMFDYAFLHGLDETAICELYYPFLYKRNILGNVQLKTEKQNLIGENKKLISTGVLKQYETVDMFYKLHYGRTDDIKYTERGISYVSFIMQPENKTIFPLEPIFKNVHATVEIPFIKFNPGNRRENIYRLYSENVSKNGKKIPVLTENAISKLSRELGKSKQLSFYVKHTWNDHMVAFYVSFDYLGQIHVSANLKRVLLPEELDQLIQSTVNPIIETINGFLQKSGYSVRPFYSLEDHSIKILDMKYTVSLPIEKKVNLQKYIGCLSSVFDVIDNDVGTQAGAKLRFKRVENFQEMDAKNAMITELYQKTADYEAVIQSLIQNYSMDRQAAKETIEKYIETHQEFEGKILENPGFNVSMRVPSSNRLLIEVENIISTGYIHGLSIYIDGILRMTQMPDKSTFLFDDVKKLCAKGRAEKNVDAPHVENIETTVAVEKTKLNSKLQPIVFDMSDDDGIFFEEADEAVNEEEMLKEIEESALDDEMMDEISVENATDEFVPEVAEIPVALSAEKIRDMEDEEEPLGAFYGSEEEMIDADKPIDQKAQEQAQSQDQDDSDDDIPLGAFYGSEEEEDTPKKETAGGSGENDDDEEDFKANIDNMPLNNPNYFFKRMHERDPELFLTQKQGKFGAYSTKCQWNLHRQPVILTNKEKEFIDKNHPGSYSKAFEYGSEPDKKHWYICPRYWCLLTNSSITEDDAKSGKCGKIIPPGSTTVPKGAYVFEFNKPDEHINSSGQYIEHYPGFLKEDSHPKGLGVPCCFSKWDTRPQKDLRAKYLTGEGTKKPKKKEDNVAPKFNEYVIDAISFPIRQNRWGFLPMSVQLFLQTDNSVSVTAANPSTIRTNSPCFLRYGIEQYDGQSFLGCMADIYAYVHNSPIIPSLKPGSSNSFREILVNSLTLDAFVRFHGGSLISIFTNDEEKNADKTVDLTKYQDSDYVKHHKEKPDHLRSTIGSFERFLAFLKDETVAIDHTYLWDMMTEKNPQLMKNGLNLVIIEMKFSDVTDSIELLCPTNSYSSTLYDTRKETVLLLKQEDFFEPIYLYEERENSEGSRVIYVKKTFSEQTNLKNIKDMLRLIQSSTNKYCTPKSSLPTKYEFKRNLMAGEMVQILASIGYNIRAQALNYQEKVIGLVVEDGEKDVDAIRFFLPCFPSAFLKETDIKYIDDDDLWSDYDTTVQELKWLSEKSGRKIPCVPVFKVIEDGIIVGILTETNQFVMLNQLAEDIKDDDLIPIYHSNYATADKALTTLKTEDAERDEMVKMILLESQFYTLFRAVVRSMLNEYENRQLRSDILSILDGPRFAYKQKISKVAKMIEELVGQDVVFSEMEKDVLMALDEVSGCAGTKSKPYCIAVKNGQADTFQLHIPSKHLISGLDNKMVYFGRMADELVRYQRIRAFMFQPKYYLNIGQTEYKINPDEFILLQSLLSSDYFEDLEPFTTNPYVNTVNFDVANPSLAHPYSNRVTLEEQTAMATKEVSLIENTTACIKEQRAIVGNVQTSMWKRVFGSVGGKELVFKNTVECSYFVLIYVLQDLYKKLITVGNVKTILWAAYSEFVPDHMDKIVAILRKQGKREMMDKVVAKKIDLETLIMVSPDYYLTDLDIWMACKHMKLPVVLFSSTKLRSLTEEIDWLVCREVDDEYLDKQYSGAHYFIRCPPDIRVGEIPAYHLVTPPCRFAELGEFGEMVRKAVVDQVPEYEKNVQTLDKYFSGIRFIKKK